MNEIYNYGIVEIIGNRLMLNKEMIYEAKGTSGSDLLGDFYKSLSLSYPKFYKMDMISKLVFISTELLVNHLKWLKAVEPEKIAVLFSTVNGSQQTDDIYKESIASAENYFPSPGIFVYTLPNIAVGELCIRHGFKGENLTLAANSEQVSNYDLIMRSWFENNSTEICIHGCADANNNSLSASFSISGTIKPNEIEP